MDATLKVLSGLLSGQSVRLPRKLVIGRAKDCDVQMDSEFVSAHHCALLLDDFTLRLLDLGSKNGTFVNGRKIGTRMTILLHGDYISIGNVNLLIDLTTGTDGAEFIPPQAVPKSDLPNIFRQASDPVDPSPHSEGGNG
jgi:pSer/pThr/pTyr-binding forkhead associated (FHA) protein